MATTIDQLETRLRTGIGNPTTAVVSQATLFQCINDALREIRDKYRQQVGEKRYQFPTVASTAAYTIPTDCQAVLMLWDVTNKARIRKGDPTQLPELATSEGYPTRYFRNQRTITLDPTPDAIYTLELYYKQGHTDLTTGQSMTLDDSWISGVVKLARYHYYDVAGNDPAKAREAYNSWTIWVNDKPGEAEEEAEDTIMGVSLGVYERSTQGRLDFDHAD